MSFVIEQDGERTAIDALSHEGQTIEEFYDYRQSQSNTTTGIERSDVSQLFLWKGPRGLSLVVLHDKPFDGSGGAVSFEFTGLPVDEGEWILPDDGNDFGSEDTTGPDWTWNHKRTDGGVFRGGLDDGFELTIVPRFNNEAERSPLSPGEISRWDVLSGDAENPDRYELDMDRPVTIASGDTHEISAAATTLSFIPGSSENSSGGGDDLDSALPDGSKSYPVFDNWFHGDFAEELGEELESALRLDKELEEFPGERFRQYRFRNEIRVSFSTDDGTTIDPDSIEITHEREEPSYSTLEGEDNPLRDNKDEYFEGKAKKRGTEEQRWSGYEIVTIESSGEEKEAIRMSAIAGSAISFVEEMFDVYRENGVLEIADLLNVPSGEILPRIGVFSRLIAFITTIPPIYTWLELTVMADGTKIVRIWDASQYPSHVCYLDAQKIAAEQVNWEPNQAINDDFNSFGLESQTPGLTPYRQVPVLGYERLFEGGMGDHPVLLFGRDANGNVLDAPDIEELLPDEPLSPV